jgi:hypothetical protein
VEQSLAEYGARAKANNKPWIFALFGNQAKICDRAWATYMRRQFNLGLRVWRSPLPVLEPLPLNSPANHEH